MSICSYDGCARKLWKGNVLGFCWQHARTRDAEKVRQSRIEKWNDICEKRGPIEATLLLDKVVSLKEWRDKDKLYEQVRRCMRKM